ncbi:MAG: hypothetical protein JO301_13955 [Chitinophagaceae bacterium]|nr:hypothetical protein [Chitinophagaceae bacterium]
MDINQALLPRYSFDTISGLTLAPSSGTIKQFLDHVDGKEFTMCYVERKDTAGNWMVVPIDYSLLKQNLGIDPFCLPDNETPNAYTDRLYNEFKFVFGFKATMSKEGLGGTNGLGYQLQWLYPSRNGRGMLVAE